MADTDAAERVRSDLADVLHELGSLRRWKAAAMTVLTEWDEVSKVLGRPGELGQTHASGALVAVTGLASLDGWLALGRSFGHCSDVVCVNHGGLPLTAAEEALPEDEWLDLCLSAVRIYDQGVPS